MFLDKNAIYPRPPLQSLCTDGSTASTSQGLHDVLRPFVEGMGLRQGDRKTMKKRQKCQLLKTFGSIKVHQKTNHTLQPYRKTVPMANMENLVDAFIVENDLDENIKDALIDLVNGCFCKYVGHLSREWLSTPVSNKSTSVSKTKKDKLEDPAEATSIDDLRNSTVDILNSYCRTHGLRIGGTKNVIMERVWRHIQGESSDEDISPRSKPPKEKVVKVKHACFSLNSKGGPCGIAATDEYEGHWFCFHHIDNAEEIINNPKPLSKGSKSSKSSKASSESDAESVTSNVAESEPESKFKQIVKRK